MTDLDPTATISDREAALTARERALTAREAAAKRGAPARKTSRRKRALPVYITMATLFIGMFGFLSARVAQGQDPALNPPKATPGRGRSAPGDRAARDRHQAHHGDQAGCGRRHSAGGTAAVSAPASSGYSAPVQQTQTQTAAAPAPAYTPPAPAPAPAATKTS